MAEGGTPGDFERWAEPHLTTLARYAGRRVAPADRDDVVHESLIRAFQRWATYDASRETPVGWLLQVLSDVCRRPHPRRTQASGVVELVEERSAAPSTDDVGLEQAVEGLSDRKRRAVDLHYFVDLDVSIVAEVLHCEPGEVTTTLLAARTTLCVLTGEDGDEEMERRLSAAARRWQDHQPPPPGVPVQRLGEPLGRDFPWRRAVAAVAAVVLVAGGAAVVVGALGGDDDSAPTSADPPPTPHATSTVRPVPFRDLEPGHAVHAHDRNGVLVTPYDDVSASGNISGTVHPGDTLVFVVVLTSPVFVSLRPCPDYTITLGTRTTTRRLNCAEVPYLASLVRSNGTVTEFRPVLPAGTEVLFRMQVTVPDQPGRQQVLWRLDGPLDTPGFSGEVDVR